MKLQMQPRLNGVVVEYAFLHDSELENFLPETSI